MFTNGTLIDDAFTDKLLEVGNLVPAISVEGYEKETDFRRGSGTFGRVMKAMEIMKKKKLIFGASCCYTRKNVELIGSDEYFDFLVGCGAKFMWCFSYTPIGKGADTSLMVTPEQRKFMYYNIRRLRSTKPLFAMDFYNDAKYVHGCIAGGRSYLHINANGDIEPCAFNHFSDANIRTDTLLEALRKPLFMLYSIWRPRVSFTSAASSASANSTIFSTVSSERSVFLSPPASEYSFSRRTAPSFLMLMTLVWKPAMRQEAEWPPAETVISMSNTSPDSDLLTVKCAVSRNFAISLVCSGVTAEMTCSSLSGSPAAMPAAAAAFRPFSPPVFGTMTLLTFLMMLPLTQISTSSGSAPRVFAAMAAA